MATPTVREVLTASQSGGGSASVITGAGTLSTDVLYCFWVDDYDTAAEMGPPSPGTWLLQGTADRGTNLPHMKLYTRTVGGGGGATTVSVTDPGEGTEIFQATYVISGVDTVNDGLSTVQSGSGTTCVLPAVSPTGSDNLLLAAYFAFIGLVNWTHPTGMTNGIEEEAADFGTLGTSRQNLVASGSTGTRTATANTTRSDFVGIMVAVKGTGSAVVSSPPYRPNKRRSLLVR